MTREEFDAKCKEITGSSPKITEGDYNLIEYVYTFHPCISETEGKEQIAYLFTTFGLTIIKDMLPRATKMEKLEAELRDARIRVNEIKDKITDVRYGCAV